MEETNVPTVTPTEGEIVQTPLLSGAQVKSAFAGKAFIQVIGRRKTSAATVRATLAKELSVTVNEKTLESYVNAQLYREQILKPLQVVQCVEPLQITVHVTGGGASGQAEAIRHGISRLLVALDPNVRTTLKRAGFLKRDPRAKERKKPGLKKARKAAQWSKR